MAVSKDFYIDNQPGAPFRSELNTILAALVTANAGSSEPPNLSAGMMWLDTSASPWKLKRRNEQNTGWVIQYDTSNKPTKADVGLGNVPNYSATDSLTDGSTSKFALASASKNLDSKKLDKTAVAADSAKLGGVSADSYALQTGTYSALRAQATTKEDVDLGNVANYSASASVTLNSNTSYALSSAVFSLNQTKLDKTAVAADSAKLGGKTPSAYAQSVHSHTADDLPTATTSVPGIIQLLDSVTSASTTLAAVPKSVKSAYDKGVSAYNLANTAKEVADKALPKLGGNLDGTLNYTLDTGIILKLDSKTVLERHSTAGAISFGADEGVVIGSGEARATTVSSVSMGSEILHLSSDSTVIVRTNLQGGWSSRQESYFEADGGFKPANAAKTRQNLDVPSIYEARIVGEICRFSFDKAPPGFFALDGSTIVNGKNDFSALANCGSRFITISGNNLILADCLDFGRGKGSSGRIVGSFEEDAIRNLTGTIGFHTNSGIVYNGEALTGVFSLGPIASTRPSSANVTGYQVNFDAARIVPTAPENRPKSLTELVCIYHGVF